MGLKNPTGPFKKGLSLYKIFLALAVCAGLCCAHHETRPLDYSAETGVAQTGDLPLYQPGGEPGIRVRGHGKGTIADVHADV